MKSQCQKRHKQRWCYDKKFQSQKFLENSANIQSVMGEKSMGMVTYTMKKKKVHFKVRIMDLAADRSLITETENLIHEIKRGIVNKKWWTLCKIKGQQKHLGIIKDLKRKKKKKDEVQRGMTT
ncbi:hypothetical protein RhiirC2_782425 [Rhizophagus irregularis]|uniref:Uncharacterized protein n=1 Tax=Rhizophagus irregularis TaxID=588596 RepID=A0A2N1N360_9GLOM|nr:hypothetical protein RhiirC2_782425 [Rhizophagus irregularis]